MPFGILNIVIDNSTETSHYKLCSLLLSNAASIDGQVLDIGANIGYYTLLAAKLGQQVVAVEPVLDSIQRLHHAAHIEHVTERIKVIYNGIADVRMKATLRQSGHNQGDSRIELRVCRTFHIHFTHSATDSQCNSIALFSSIILSYAS